MPAPTSNLLRINVGCGADKRAGWVCVDANPDLKPDVVALADKLPMFGDRSAEVIEACHLLEHLPLDDPQRRRVQEGRQLDEQFRRYS